MNNFKEPFVRGPTGYNQFAASLKGTDIKDFGSEWAKLSKKQKDDWKTKANEVKSNPDLKNLTERQKTMWRKKYLKKILNACDVLEELDVKICGVATIKGDVTVFGSPKSLAFMKKSGHTRGDYLMQATGSADIGTKAGLPSTRGELRKCVQEMFNNKYSNTVGKKSRMPYNNPSLRVEGMPIGIKFGVPSKYGKRQCQEILKNSDKIKVSVSNLANDTLPSLKSKEAEANKFDVLVLVNNGDFEATDMLPCSSQDS